MGRPSDVWAVYALHDPNGDVRYIGISKCPEDRLRRHYRECRTGTTHKNNWLRALLESSEAPMYSILEWTDDWNEAEKRWVAYFKASGAKLVNGTEGGKTHRGTRVPNPHPTVKRMYRILESNARSRYGTPRDFEILGKYREIVSLQRKNGTLDMFEERLVLTRAARNN